jgi:membrane associated rhomboid family serine protease
MDDGHTTAIEIGRTTRLDRLLRFASAPSGGWRSVAVFGAVFGFLAGAIFAFKDYRRDQRRRR